MAIVGRNVRVVTFAALFVAPIGFGCMTDLTKMPSALQRLRAPVVVYSEPWKWTCKDIRAQGKDGRLEDCAFCLAKESTTITMNDKEEPIDPGDTVTQCLSSGWLHGAKPPKPSQAPTRPTPDVQEVRRL